MIKENLLNEYKYKFELHAHTKPVSLCSEISAEKYVELFTEANFDGMALTNHFNVDTFRYKDVKKDVEYYLNDYYNLKSLAKGNLTVCLGLEIRFTENHNDYLVYGISENDAEKAYYYLDKGIAEFYREFKNDRNIIIQAHPFRDGMILADDSCVDGIELFNFHAGHNGRNAFAADYIRKHPDKIFAGGTDFHHLWQQDLAAARFKYLPQDSYELSDALKAKDFIFTIGDSIILP